MLVAFGCGPDRLETQYGRHRLTGQQGSVNGTDVLAAMFSDAGHDVHFRRTLVTDEMEAADIVVWFPDDEAAPRDEVCKWFDTWLSEYPGRTLVFVGRDFDAGPLYWKYMIQQRQKDKNLPVTVAPKSNSRPKPPAKAKKPPESEAKSEAPQPKDSKSKSAPGKSADNAKKKSPEQDATDAKKEDAKKDDGRKDDAKDDEAKEDSEEDLDEVSPWLTYEDGDQQEIRELEGPWAAGIDAGKTEIELSTRLVPIGEVEKLLTSDDQLLVSRLRQPQWNESQVLLIANGSFLLNLPLVNHEHRKLAGKLIAATGEPGQVVFLESGRGGPRIDPAPTDSSIWTLFEAWPLGAILLQLAAVGVMFCFARWPIFGRPKQPPPETTADFGKHVTAVGQLIARTKDRQFALDRLRPVEAAGRPSAPTAPPEPNSSASTSNLARRPPASPPESKGL
jgi:hypothetical protein